MAKKEEFSFSEIFNNTIEDYKKNIKPLFKFILIFIGIPALIFSLIQFSFLIVDPNLFEMFSLPELLKQWQMGDIRPPLYYTLFSIFMFAVTILLSIFVSAGIINASLKKSKFSFKDLMRNANERYWKFFAFNVVMAIFLILLTLLLIIPGIIFLIYWILGDYVFFDKKENIRPSLKKSRLLLKGRWWKTFGYSLLMLLIVGVFAMIVNIIQLPTIIITALNLANNTPLSITFLGISSLLEVIGGFFASLITMPLMVLFFKNYYLELKKIKKIK